MPINSACNCCEVSTAPPSLEYVSISKACNAPTCGEIPCTSTEGQTCSPNYAELSEEEKCNPLRYLTVTTVDTSGGGTHGRTQTKQYALDEVNNCTLTTSCSGSNTTTTTYSGSCSGSESCTTTYNGDCSTTIGNGSGSIQADIGGGLCCSSTVNSDCSSSGEIYFCGDEPTGVPNFEGSCSNFQCTAETTSSPVVDGLVAVTYTNPNTTGDCTPTTLPPYPTFIDCTPEGEEPPEEPPLEEGQGRGLPSDTAFKFTNPNNPAIKSEKRIKYRIAHNPIGTCYFKVWIRKVILQYKWEDCDTGFAGNPPRTPAWNVNCELTPCATRWSTDGGPIVEDGEIYEWEGIGYPCFDDKTKLFSACENIIYSSEKEIIAGENQQVVIEAKYSFIKDYEPNWPDENGESRLAGFGGCQGCRPNGFPITNSADCPVCE